MMYKNTKVSVQTNKELHIKMYEHLQYFITGNFYMLPWIFQRAVYKCNVRRKLPEA